MAATRLKDAVQTVQRLTWTRSGIGIGWVRTALGSFLLLVRAVVVLCHVGTGGWATPEEWVRSAPLVDCGSAGGRGWLRSRFLWHREGERDVMGSFRDGMGG